VFWNGEKMKYFPLFIGIENKQVIVIGGGKIATRRVETLLQFKCNIRVIAPQVTERIYELEKLGLLQLEQRNYEKADCQGAYLILAATDDRQINHNVFLDAKENGILVNVCDDKEECDFYFPGIVAEDDIVVGVTCSGHNHKLARKIREEIEKFLKILNSENPTGL
jgi:precorrin-2 dehydrogenase/sirohydrochlorin ferrochelatase